MRRRPAMGTCIKVCTFLGPSFHEHVKGERMQLSSLQRGIKDEETLSAVNLNTACLGVSRPGAYDEELTEDTKAWLTPEPQPADNEKGLGLLRAFNERTDAYRRAIGPGSKPRGPKSHSGVRPIHYRVYCRIT